MNRLLLTAVLVLVGTLGLGCDGRDAAVDTEPAAVDAGVGVLPPELILTAAPQNARGVSEVRAAAAGGDTVVVRGVIAGRADPIAEKRAIFTLLDESVQTCDKNPADACATPWDACCEPQDVIAANAATVQVVDAEGRPLKVGLAGVGGLKPLSRVTVVGTLTPSSDSNSASINATGLYVAD